MLWILVCLLTIGYLLKLRNREPDFKRLHKNTSQYNDKAGLELSTEQHKVLNYLLSSQNNIFVTGKAGTGKSLLLKHFRQANKKNLVVTAPTGIAALNVDGQTIHSLFKINRQGHNQHRHKVPAQTAKLLRALDVLIIDEISMVRADIIDEIDSCLKCVRGRREPFGGVQLIMFGDLYQLPPIVNDKSLLKYLHHKYAGIFFFQAKVWKQTKLETLELTKVFRQRSNDFQRLLNAVRVGDISEVMLDTLNQRIFPPPTGKDIVTVAATNQTVDEINAKMLSQIGSREYVYRTESDGNIKARDYMANKVLRLKVGAQVMMTRNDPDKRWVNGSLGRVARLSKNSIVVRINGRKFIVGKATWEKVNYTFDTVSGKVKEIQVGKFTQYPIRLAWAVTIHKSQGQTYEACQVDLKHGVFAHGQAYVALSRCKSLDGLYLLSPILRSDLSVAPEVVKFMADRQNSIA